MQKGYAMPMVLLVIFVLLLLPVGFWAFQNNFNFANTPSNVKGTSTVAAGYSKPGFSVMVSSQSNWDLLEYLCTSLSECTNSLYSGVRFGAVSGGETENHEVIIDRSDDWSKYSHIKYFVRSGWSSPTRTFNVVNLGDYPDSKEYKLSDGGVEYNVVISNLTGAETKFYKSATFSD